RPSSGAPGGGPRAGGPAAAPPAGAPAGTSTGAAPVKAEGWGTLKGQVLYGSNAPEPVVLFEKGKAPKDAEVVCSKNGPIMSERLVVDAATKGVKNVLVYLSKPTAVKPEAKEAASK